jgi:flagellar hook-length control protein FliK
MLFAFQKQTTLQAGNIMGISVVHSVAPSGGKQSSTASNNADDAAPMDFSALLAGQIADASTLPPVDISKLELSLADTKAQLIGQNDDSGDLNPAANAAIAIFDVLSPRDLKSTQDNNTDLADILAGQVAIGNNLGKTSPPLPEKNEQKYSDTELVSQIGGGSLTSKLLGAPPSGIAEIATAIPSTTLGTAQNRALATEALAGNIDPAKLAGESTSGATDIRSAGGSFSNILASQERTTNTTLNVAAPLNDPRWAQQMGERVVWLARGDIQNAQININPAQLGPIQINISLQGDQMSAHFAAVTPEVRQALEEAMPRLREMLSGAGISLGQANVGSQTPQQQRESPPQFSDAPRLTGEDAILSQNTLPDPGRTGLPVQRGRGLVDLFA